MTAAASTPGPADGHARQQLPPGPLELPELQDMLARGQSTDGPGVLARCRERLAQLDERSAPEETLWLLLVITAVHGSSADGPAGDRAIVRMVELAERSGSELWRAAAGSLRAVELTWQGAVTEAFIELSRAMVMLEEQIDIGGRPLHPGLSDDRDGTFLLSYAVNATAVALGFLGLIDRADLWFGRSLGMQAHGVQHTVGTFYPTLNRGWFALRSGLLHELAGRTGHAFEQYRLSRRLFRQAAAVGDPRLRPIQPLAELMATAMDAMLGDVTVGAELETLIAVQEATPGVGNQDRASEMTIARTALAVLRRRSGDTVGAAAVLNTLPVRTSALTGTEDVVQARVLFERSVLAQHGRTATEGERDLLQLSRFLLDVRERELQARVGYFDHALADERQRRAAATSSRLLLIDELTGLGNRRRFEQWIAELPTAGPRSSGVVVFVDIDAFKGVNDSFSHIVGDIVLQELAECLADVLGQDDLAVRFGGDEFVVVLSGLDVAGGRGVLDEVAAAFADRTARHSRIARPLSFSVGLARYHPAVGFPVALEQADQELLSAKRRRPAG